MFDLFFLRSIESARPNTASAPDGERFVNFISFRIVRSAAAAVVVAAAAVVVAAAAADHATTHRSDRKRASENRFYAVGGTKLDEKTRRRLNSKNIYTIFFFLILNTSKPMLHSNVFKSNVIFT